ncbi:hypothetical protein BJ875DRAFT_484854 [Amylocarpus encephaloides]|uniref:Uncharacterized protein n=1 Tax=Amylocarpus encephaloides TaxID=45428 RepID=A0A9P7YHK7_9HELO|nr:hypothetical protein BJ875DRAFT_484854 [Amylocarpus encephaloides]
MRAITVAALQLGIITGVLSQSASIIQVVDPTNSPLTIIRYCLPAHRPSRSPVINLSMPLFHEASVYLSSNQTTVFATSNQYNIATSSNTTTKAASISMIIQQESDLDLPNSSTSHPQLPS